MTRSARRARRARRGRRPGRAGTSSATGSKRSRKRSAMRARSSSRPSPVSGGDLHRAGEAVAEAPAPERVDRVDLVHDDLTRQLVGADVGEHVLDGGHRLVEPLVGLGGVDDVQDEVGDERLLERRGEALHELRGQPADEADGVGDEVAPAVVLEPARGRVERLEEAVVDRTPGVGERVQERRLADVRVPGERDDGRRAALPLLAPRGALACDAGEPALELRDAACARGGGRSRAGSRRGPASPPRRRSCRGRRRGARGAATCRACAGGCTRAAPARPGACPRP